MGISFAIYKCVYATGLQLSFCVYNFFATLCKHDLWINTWSKYIQFSIMINLLHAFLQDKTGVLHKLLLRCDKWNVPHIVFLHNAHHPMKHSTNDLFHIQLMWCRPRWPWQHDNHLLRPLVHLPNYRIVPNTDLKKWINITCDTYSYFSQTTMQLLFLSGEMLLKSFIPQEGEPHDKM